jgi:hypothetical protein
MLTGNTPGIRFDQDNTNGFTPQAWDVAGNEANFFVRDVTGGSKLPLRIRPGAPTSSLDISGSGNVGIGTASPAQKLDVQGTGSTYASVTGAGGNAGMILNSGAGSSALLKSNGSDGSFTLENPNGLERFRLTADGKVGINSAAPPHALTVVANASSYVNLISAGGNAGHIFTAGPREAVIRENIADGSFVWENPNGTERMRITNTGNVGIGTTNPTNPLQMGSGAFVSAGGVWTNASSRTLKDKIADLPVGTALEAFAQLTPVTFVYKASPTEGHVGFIAEDVPALVATPDRKSLAAMDIVALLTKVVQAQQATIADLTARLARLEALADKQEK